MHQTWEMKYRCKWVSKPQPDHESEMLYRFSFLAKATIFFFFFFFFFFWGGGGGGKKREEGKLFNAGSRLYGLTLYQTTKFRISPNSKNNCRWQNKWDWKNKHLYREGYKTLWEKEKMLDTSNFSYSCNVFKSPLSQGLCGKELNCPSRANFFQ